MANSRDEILLQLLLLRSPHYRQSYILHGRVVERKRKSKFFRISLQISFPLLLNEPFQIRELLSQSSPPSNTFSISVQRLGDFFYYAPPEIFFISSVFGIVLYNQPSPDGCTDGCEKVVPPLSHDLSFLRVLFLHHHRCWRWGLWGCRRTQNTNTLGWQWMRTFRPTLVWTVLVFLYHWGKRKRERKRGE